MAHRQKLAFLMFFFYLVAGQPPIYKLKGLEVNFIPSVSTRPDEILWKHNGDKVVDFNGREEQVFSPYKNRVTLDYVSAELSIAHLRHEDSGEYELETYTNGVLAYSRYKLEVMDRVANPTISCEMIDSSNSNSSAAPTEIQATLVCSANSSLPHSLLKFEWASRGNMHPGPKLPISLGGELDNEVYSCDVSNPLSNDIALFNAKDCYPDKSLSVGVIAGIVIGVIAIIVFLLLLVLLVIYFHRKTPKDQKTPQGEREPFLNRAPTLPSNQRLYALQKNLKPEDSGPEAAKVPASPLSPTGGKPTSHPDLSTESVHHEKEAPPCDSSDPDKANEDSEDLQADVQSSDAPEQTAPASPLSNSGSRPLLHLGVNMESVHHGSNNKGDASSEKELTPCDSFEPEKANEADPASELDDSFEPEKANKADAASELDDVSEDMQSVVHPSTVPDQKDSEKESDEKARPASGSAVTPPQLCSPSSQSSPPGDITGKLQEDTTSDQVNGVTTAKNHASDSSDDPAKEKPLSTIPTRKVSGCASPLPPADCKPPSHLDVNIEPVNHASNNMEEDSDAPDKPEEANEPDPPDSENEADEDEEAKFARASAVTTQLHSASTTQTTGGHPC